MSFARHLAYAVVGFVLGAIAGATAGYRHHAYRPAPDELDVVIRMADMREAARRN